MIKVAVFEDHKGRREALELLISLQPDMHCSGSFGDCRNLVDNLKGNPPDVTLMDIHMPNVDGIEGVKLLQRYFPSTYIIIQTVFEDDENIFNCLTAGAHGYILKQASNDRLIEAIHEVVNGGAPMTASIARRVLEYFSKRSKRNTETYDLSKREIEVLTELVNGLSQKMIAAKLFISVHTVNNHISRIYEKLHVHSVSEAVVTAIQKNII
ncbi:LuxR family two component transcriptional regulator [Larkinella arboricola]|uniref:LuxR family two component transcriptional regulator n=1 Tax=Larkinella arboricola TaxID=643671 RepID=A0A327WVW2_LARAB|nr:response regulator transcription factor [Larkinella arboricola]RAJ93240.1 LuxR family two component transcriptional regulator [Larkinella arboricola]